MLDTLTPSNVTRIYGKHNILEEFPENFQIYPKNNLWKKVSLVLRERIRPLRKFLESHNLSFIRGINYNLFLSLCISK